VVWVLDVRLFAARLLPLRWIVPPVGVRVLPLIGFLSIEALLPDLGAPLVTGVEILLGEEDPNPTTFCWLSTEVLACAPLIEEERRTFEPLGESSEFNERLEPALELGLDPPLLPGIPDCLRVNPICSSRYLRMEAASSGLMDCLGIGKLRSDFSLILVIGPEMLGRCADSPDIEPLGLLSLGFDLNGVML
jgi:hypothetical protein